MSQVLTDPKCFEAMDAPEPEDVTCSKLAQSVSDLKIVADELNVLGVRLLRLAERLNALSGPT